MLAIGLGLWIGSRSVPTGGGGGGGTQPSALTIANHSPDPMVTPVTVDVTGFDETYLEGATDAKVQAFLWNGTSFNVSPALDSGWITVTENTTVNFNLSSLAQPNIYRIVAYGRTGGGPASPISNLLLTGAIAPQVTSSATASVNENTVLAYTLTSNVGSSTFAITGGADAAKFEISGTTLRWLGNGTKDYELPDDTGTNNIYDVQVTATAPSGIPGSAFAIAITVLDVLEQGPNEWDSQFKTTTYALVPSPYRTLTGTNGYGANAGARSTNSKSSGAWYTEALIGGDYTTFPSNAIMFGVVNASYNQAAFDAGTDPGGGANGIRSIVANGYADVQGVSQYQQFSGSPFDNGSPAAKRFMLFVDITLGKGWWGVNGTWMNGNPSARTGGFNLPTGALWLYGSAQHAYSLTLPVNAAALVYSIPTGGSAWTNP